MNENIGKNKKDILLENKRYCHRSPLVICNTFLRFIFNS